MTLTDSAIEDADFTGAAFWGTALLDMDLSRVHGLEATKHFGPSRIDINTLEKSRKSVPHLFWQRAGLPSTLTAYLDSLFDNAIDFYSCFISYAEQDSDFAERLYEDLTNNGLRCYKWDHDARTGQPLWDEIDSAIRMYDRLIVILSENSLKSPAVQREIERAIQCQDRLNLREHNLNTSECTSVLFPVRLDDHVFAWDHYRQADLVSHVIADARGWRESEEKYQAVLEGILKDLARETEAHGMKTSHIPEPTISWPGPPRGDTGQRVVMVTPVEHRQAANQLAEQLDPEIGGEQTFSVALSPTGDEPATHFACNGRFSRLTVTRFQNKLPEVAPGARVFEIPDNNPGEGFRNILKELGLVRWGDRM
jgi:hypothetical protein